MATYSGPSAAAPALVISLLEQTTAVSLCDWSARTDDSISARVRRLSEWLTSDPAAPASLSVSAVIWPVLGAGLGPVHVLCVDRDRKVVAERVDVDVPGRDADYDTALACDQLCGSGDLVGTVAHALPVRLEIHQDQGRCHLTSFLVLEVLHPGSIQPFAPLLVLF